MSPCYVSEKPLRVFQRALKDVSLLINYTSSLLSNIVPLGQEHLELIKKMENMLKQIDVEESDLKYLIRTLRS